MKDEYRTHLERAVYLARTKSGVRTFQTGAVLVNWRGVTSEGWSHYSGLNLTRYRSIHAEMHALLRCGKSDPFDGTMFVATIRGKSGNVGLGKPCGFCHELLYDACVREVWFTVEEGEYDHFRVR